MLTSFLSLIRQMPTFPRYCGGGPPQAPAMADDETPEEDTIFLCEHPASLILHPGLPNSRLPRARIATAVCASTACLRKTLICAQQEERRGWCEASEKNRAGSDNGRACSTSRELITIAGGLVAAPVAAHPLPLSLPREARETMFPICVPHIPCMCSLCSLCVPYVHPKVYTQPP